MAQQIGFLYLDTGAMYRAIAWGFLEAGWTPDDVATKKEIAIDTFVSSLRVDVTYEDGDMRVRLNGEEVTGRLRTGPVSAMTSRISTIPLVRSKLVNEQRRIARQHVGEGGGIILDGRDIGTVVFPNADLKIYLVADVQERARRRWEELGEEEAEKSVETIRKELEERDRQDAERALAPLRQAEDAISLDTSELTIDEQVRFVIERIEERR